MRACHFVYSNKRSKTSGKQKNLNSKTKPADSSKNDSNNEGREDEVALAAAVADSDEMGSHHSNDHRMILGRKKNSKTNLVF